MFICLDVRSLLGLPAKCMQLPGSFPEHYMHMQPPLPSSSSLQQIDLSSALHAQKAALAAMFESQCNCEQVATQSLRQDSRSMAMHGNALELAEKVFVCEAGHPHGVEAALVHVLEHVVE